MESTLIAAFGLIGLAIVLGFLGAVALEHRAHQRWIEENNRRRFQLADAEKARAKAIRNAK